MKAYNNKYYFIILLFQLLNSSAFAQQLVSQPFIGHTSKNEIHFWCMFKNADTVYLKNSDQQKKIFTSVKANSFRKYFPVNCTFSALKENQVYTIQYSFDDQNYFPLITAHTATDSIRDFEFLAGSCAFIPTGFNSIIKPFSSSKIFNSMQCDSADFMLWLGDNLYYVLQRKNYKAQLKRNVKTRLHKKLNQFLNSTQHYAIWDDHDYGSNNSDASFKYKESSLSIFQQFWPNPKNDSFNYYTFHQQDCQFFMLDDRYHNEPEKSVLGKTQLSWLKNELLQSKATFKFICIGMQALNPVSSMECLYKSEMEYRELIAFIKQQHITGILFISGDRHHAELMKIEEQDLYPLYDFTTSPLTMYPVKLSKKSLEFKNPYKVANTYFPSYNYGKIGISGDSANRKCTIELKDKDGNIVWTKQISANELR